MSLLFTIRPKQQKDAQFITELLASQWAGPMLVSRGNIYDASLLPAFVAEDKTTYIGLITYRIDKYEIEITSLNSLTEKQGIGSSLIHAVINEAMQNNISRVWVGTTNNNSEAIQFYKNRGLQIKLTYKNAVEQSRKLKPSIPMTDEQDRPIRDEIILEYRV